MSYIYVVDSFTVYLRQGKDRRVQKVWFWAFFYTIVITLGHTSYQKSLPEWIWYNTTQFHLTKVVWKKIKLGMETTVIFHPSLPLRDENLYMLANWLRKCVVGNHFPLVQNQISFKITQHNAIFSYFKNSMVWLKSYYLPVVQFSLQICLWKMVHEFLLRTIIGKSPQWMAGPGQLCLGLKDK